MGTTAMALRTPAQWIAERRRVADDAIVAYMCHYAAASVATVCGIAADDAWDRAQAVLDTAVTAGHAAHPYTIAAELGAATAADYLQENHTMPELSATPPNPPDRWLRLWSLDCARVLWDSRKANPAADVLEAAKQFMADHGLDEATITVDWGNDWKARWSGRIFRPAHDADYQLHDASAFLRYLTVPANPFFEGPR